MGRKPIYTVDENYFEKIDTNNKAYILGFIYADGNIHKNVLTISLSYKDIEILEFIKNELKYDGIIKHFFIKNREYVRLCITSKKIINDLINLGIIKNKTYLSKKLPNYGNHFNSFLLGFFDGDGSIYNNSYKNRSVEYGITFSSNIDVLNEIKNILKINNISSSKIRKRYNNDISCMLEIRGNINIEKIFNFLYSSSDFYLNRKYKIFEQFNENLKYMKKRKLLPNTINIIKDMYLNGVKQFEISKSLKIPKSTTRCVIQRLRKYKEII